MREDLERTQRALLEYLSRPGCWFTGAERIALAGESRGALSCPLCLARKAALSPEHAQGEHARVSELPEALIELAHRVRGDPQRLSKGWFERTRASGVEEGAYVEAVGIVSFVAGLDFFCRAFGLAPFELREPLPGDPSRRRPAGARDGTAWVAMLAPEDAAGPEADLYGNAALVPNIVRALSLVPDHVRMLQQMMATHYVPLTDPRAGRDLDRMQIELVAARVSALNECFY